MSKYFHWLRLDCTSEKNSEPRRSWLGFRVCGTWVWVAHYGYNPTNIQHGGGETRMSLDEARDYWTFMQNVGYKPVQEYPPDDTTGPRPIMRAVPASDNQIS